MSFFRDVQIQDLGRRSDIKVPWELSRLQWLAPVAQAYLIDGDEKYAEFARDVLESWMVSNPYARGPNWAVTMEPATDIYVDMAVSRLSGHSSNPTGISALGFWPAF